MHALLRLQGQTALPSNSLFPGRPTEQLYEHAQRVLCIIRLLPQAETCKYERKLEQRSKMQPSHSHFTSEFVSIGRQGEEMSTTTQVNVLRGS